MFNTSGKSNCYVQQYGTDTVQLYGTDTVQQYGTDTVQLYGIGQIYGTVQLYGNVQLYGTLHKIRMSFVSEPEIKKSIVEQNSRVTFLGS